MPGMQQCAHSAAGDGTERNDNELSIVLDQMADVGIVFKGC